MSQPEGYVRIRAGETRPVPGQATISTGTLTIQGTPAPTVTLYDLAGSIVPGFNAAAVSGYNNTALANPEAWLNLAGTVSPAEYKAVFNFTALGSDNVTRVYEPEIVVRVIPAG